MRLFGVGWLLLLLSILYWRLKVDMFTSAYRCRVYNKRIGGIPNSSHVRGYAVDIKCTNSLERQRILEFLLGERVKRIGIHPRFIHFDLDPEKPSPRVWLYGKRRHVA